MAMLRAKYKTVIKAGSPKKAKKKKKKSSKSGKIKQRASKVYSLRKKR